MLFEKSKAVIFSSMGSKERKEREKLAKKQLIIDAAMGLARKGGIESITLRDVAKAAEYSPAALYEYFENKEALLFGMCERTCQDLLKTLGRVKKENNPRQFFLDLMRATINFHIQEPQGVELLTYVCFNPDSSKVPGEFLSCVDFFEKTLKEINCKRVQSKQELQDALDVLRAFLAGASVLISAQDSLEGRLRTQKILESAIETLLRGWDT